MAEIPLSDYGVQWFKDILGQITAWFRDQLTEGYRSITTGLFDTPLPNGSGIEVVFGMARQSDTVWYDIYQSTVGGEIMILSLIVLFLSVQGRHFVRIFNFGSPQVDRRSRRRAWTGGILIVSWYWVGVLCLYLVDGVTVGLIPNVAKIGGILLTLIPVAGSNPMMTLVLTSIAAVSLSALKAIYFLRELLLYVYLYGMPIGLAFAFGNLPVVSQIAARFCRQFIPLAVLPIPAAVLFRGYALLFGGTPVVSPTEALFGYVVAISLPLVGLYLTWKTFRYAAPLVTGALSRTASTAATLGVVAGVGTVTGAGAAATTARFGPRAGLTHAAVKRIRADGDGRDDDSHRRSATTAQDNVTTDTNDGGGIPAYRRAENDPGYY